MRRCLNVCLCAVVLWLAAASPAFSQESNFGDDYLSFYDGVMSGTSPYLKPFSLDTLIGVVEWVLLLLLYLVWVTSTDWLNQDRFHQRANKAWNVAMFAPFAGLLVLFWMIPYFAIGYSLLVIAWMAPFITYVVKRNPLVPDEEKVFTKQHLRHWSAAKLEKIGIKMRTEEKGIDDIGPPLKLSARGGASERDDAANLLLARQSEGYLIAREVLAGGLDNRAEAILLDDTSTAVAVRYQVDGVWHPAEGLEREPGDLALAVLKTISAMNAAERRARQQGVFGAEYKGEKHTCRVTSQGTKTGERALLQFEDPNVKKKRPLELGMREKMLEQLKPALETKSGLVIVSTPPGGGLTALIHAITGVMDRYTRGFVAIEDAATAELEVENVPVTTYDGAAGESPLTVLPKMIREYPDVFVVPDMKDADSAALLCAQTGQDRTVVTTARAKEAAEALLRVLALGMPADQLASAVKVVLNQRLVRKLCEKCKEAYPPPPQVLQKLGIPPGRVEAFYQPPTPDPEQPQEPCKKCRGVGYFGRTGIFEMLIVDDQVRQALVASPKVEVLRAAARKAGMRSLQEEGLLLVVTGVTSLPELMRALKE